MIKDKLMRFLDSRLFSAILNLVLIILAVISYFAAEKSATPFSIIGLALFIVCCILFAISLFLIAFDKEIKSPAKFKKSFEIDERFFFIIAGILMLAFGIIIRVQNPVGPLGFDTDALINLWISIGAVSFVAAIQAHFTHVL